MKWLDGHMPKFVRLHCFHQSLQTDLHQTFSGAISGLYNSVFKLRPSRSREVAMMSVLTDLWRLLARIDTPRLHSLCRHSTTVGRIKNG